MLRGPELTAEVWETSPRSPDAPSNPPPVCNLLLAGLVSLAALVGTNPTGALPSSSLKVAAAPRATSNLDCSGLFFSIGTEYDSRVHELRNRWGLTVGQIAELAGVSRRTVHTWMNGGRIRRLNAENLEHVAALLGRRASVRKTGRPSRTMDSVHGGGDGLSREVNRLEAFASRRRDPIPPATIETREVFGEANPEPEFSGRPAFGRVLGVVQAPSGESVRERS